MLIGLAKLKVSVNRCVFSFRLKPFREVDARMFCGSLFQAIRCLLPLSGMFTE